MSQQTTCAAAGRSGRSSWANQPSPAPTSSTLRDRGAVDMVGDDAPEEAGPSHLPRVPPGALGIRLDVAAFAQVHQSAFGSKSDGGGAMNTTIG